MADLERGIGFDVLDTMEGEMPEINGKQVEYRKQFPARDNWDLPGLLSSIGTTAREGTLNLKNAVPLLQRVITSWDYDGDPSDPEAYDDMDIFRDVVPLVTAVAAYIGGLTSGEAESEPTSP